MLCSINKFITWLPIASFIKWVLVIIHDKFFYVNLFTLTWQAHIKLFRLSLLYMVSFYSTWRHVLVIKSLLSSLINKSFHMEILNISEHLIFSWLIYILIVLNQTVGHKIWTAWYIFFAFIYYKVLITWFYSRNLPFMVCG